MIRRTKFRLLLMTALFHLFADVAFAGGAVLCVGSNDHFAIESLSGVPGDCQTVEQTAESGFTNAGSGSEDCSDSPLHVEAELVSTWGQASYLDPNLVPVPGDPFEFDLTRVHASNLRNAAVELPPDLRALRTIVLLI